MIRKRFFPRFIILIFMGLVLTSCSRQPAMITFVSDLHTPQVCGNLPQNPVFKVDFFAFFVSSVELFIDDEWRAVDFLPTNKQTVHSSLIDLTPQCETPETQTQLNLPLALSHHQFADATKIRFSLGVPFAHNHKNPLTQPAPLNEPVMFWSWQRGYKFIRWDLQNENSGEGWSYHLGSVGCMSASALRPPEQPCATPNRFTLTIDKPTNDGYVFVRSQALLQGIDLNASQGCMFHSPEEADCSPLVANTQNDWISWVNR